MKMIDSKGRRYLLPRKTFQSKVSFRRGHTVKNSFERSSLYIFFVCRESRQFVPCFVFFGMHLVDSLFNLFLHFVYCIIYIFRNI